MGGTKMTKKVKRILGVIMGAAVMMAAAGCGQSADTGTKDAQEVKASETNAENADSAQAESAEEVTGTIEMWSMLTQQERADELQKLADSYMEQNPGTGDEGRHGEYIQAVSAASLQLAGRRTV